jgi:polyhydroxybutyrate depolymerase
MKKLILALMATALLYHTGVAQEYSIQHNGLTRTYRLHLPAGFSPDSLYPLVINMHGLGSNALEQELYTAFNTVSDTGNFIVTYPNAVNGAWNVLGSGGTDDVGFISALIDTLASEYNIDLMRVYSTGMSMGGFMSYRLACELENRIAAIASVTGLLALFPCDPDRPVPILQMHGTADEVVPYSGVATTISHWVNHNGCPATPVITDLPDINTNDQSTVTVSYYGLCEDLTEVILYTINGGEHTWPGAPIIIGVTNMDINASSEIWNFFKKYSLSSSSTGDDPFYQDGISLEVFPNPVGRHATLEFKSDRAGRADFRLYDPSGKLLTEKTYEVPGRVLLESQGLPPGVYLGVAEQEGKQFRAKIVIR